MVTRCLEILKKATLVLALAGLLEVQSLQTAHAASAWINCGGYQEGSLVLGADATQLDRNASLMCPRGFKVIVQCAGPGWYGIVESPEDSAKGFACGYTSRAGAYVDATRSCNNQGGRCNIGRTGNDTGQWILVEPGTATMGSVEDESF